MSSVSLGNSRVRYLDSSLCAAALETVDLEITQQHTLFGCQLESSFGGRYAEHIVSQQGSWMSCTIVSNYPDRLATRHLRGCLTLGLSGRRIFESGLENAGELLPEMDCESCGLRLAVVIVVPGTVHPCFPQPVLKRSNRLVVG